MPGLERWPGWWVGLGWWKTLAGEERGDCLPLPSSRDWAGPIGRLMLAVVPDASNPDDHAGQTDHSPDARVLLLSRPGCHLCDDARLVVERVTTELGEPYVERDITLDAADLQAYGESIPVVFVDGVQIDFWRVSEDRLRAALRPNDQHR